MHQVISNAKANKWVQSMVGPGFPVGGGGGGRADPLEGGGGHRPLTRAKRAKLKIESHKGVCRRPLDLPMTIKPEIRDPCHLGAPVICLEGQPILEDQYLVVERVGSDDRFSCIVNSCARIHTEKRQISKEICFLTGSVQITRSQHCEH